MPKIEQQFEEGDTITLTVKGKVVSPNLAGTPQGTKVRVERPGKVLFASLERVNGITVDLVLDDTAEVEVDHKSQHPNGVHIDADGKYWMRKNGKWHSMTVAATPRMAPVGTGIFNPKSPQRLVEPKD
jgi:sugar lactone lactonase YvrE